MSKTPCENIASSAMSRRLNIGANLQPMSLEGNVAVNWKKWYQSFLIFLKASGIFDDTNDRKVAILLHFIGEKCVEIFNTFDMDIENVPYMDVIAKFEEYFIPKTNITYECYKFFTTKQQESESLEDFLTNLINKSKSCEFETLTDRIIKDIYICNMHEKFQHVREKLLLEDNLTLEKARNISKTLVSTLSQAHELKESANIFYNQHHNFPLKDSSSLSASRSKSRPRSQSQNRNKCGRCGQIHRHKCPAIHVKCRKCKLFGHYEAFCKSKKVHYIQKNDMDDKGNDSNYLFVGHLNSTLSVNSDWSINMMINNINVQCILDTGSDPNVMSYQLFQTLNIIEKFQPCLAKVTSYCGSSIPILGEQSILCTYYINSQSKTRLINFIIANVSSPTVIGKFTCTDLGFIKRLYNIERSELNNECRNNFSVCQEKDINSKSNCLVFNNNNINNYCYQSELQSYNLQRLLSKYKSIFDGLDCLPGEFHITVNSDVRPKIDAPRKIPFSLHDRLKKELDNMESIDVIAKVTEPTSWVSSLLLVEKKNGQLRVCLDPRNLNEAIYRSHYPIPTIDTVRSKLHGASCFSTLDASSGFWVICLVLESSMLCTFNTPFGRYRFKRLPYGINCAPEIFHRIMTETFGVLPGVMVYADDILVFGKDSEEHDKNLKRVFEKAQEVNLKFNRNKCKFGHTEVKYLGHIFSKSGVSPDPEKHNV